MISLDEDYMGWATDAILVRGLKVCGGLLCVLNNNRLVGAHFTNITTTAEIFTSCQYMVNHMFAGGHVTRMYFIYNMNAWGNRNDKYASAHTLLSELKILTNYNGVIRVYDKNIIGLSVDVKLSSLGGNLQIGYRITPNPDPATAVPNSNVRRVKTAHGSHTPVVHFMGGAYSHMIPNNRGGFVPFVDSMFAQV